MAICQYRIYKAIRMVFYGYKNNKKSYDRVLPLKVSSRLDTNSLLVWEIFETNFVSYILSSLFGTDIFYPTNVTQEILIHMEPRLQASRKDVYNLK